MSEFRLIYLVGFMGSGKTTLGRRLAELLGWAFVDLDEEIERIEKMPIAEIFKLKGEAYFRSLERRELGHASAAVRTVVAAGGGAFCHAKNMEVMRRTGISIWLDAPAELLYERCSKCPDTRPLFSGRDEMSRLLQSRVPFYARADLRVEVGLSSVDEQAQRILDALRRSVTSQ